MSTEISEVVRKVHILFKERGLTLSVAESCTGGLIAHSLTNLAGASAFFEAGVTTYSNSAKKALLGIPSEILSNYGAVSKEVAKEMAERVRALTKTDYALSTTGNLGPDVLEGKEKGLVYIVVSKEGQTNTKELHLTGDRLENKEHAALLALQFLLDIAST